MQETHVLSLGQEDPLEEGMATHSSILAWRIPWTEEPGGCSPWDRRVGNSRAPHSGSTSISKLLANSVMEDRDVKYWHPEVPTKLF